MNLSDLLVRILIDGRFPRLVMGVILTVGIVPCVSGCTLPEGQTTGSCSDGADNDGDGTFDCADDGCKGSPDCDAALSDDSSEWGPCTTSLPVYACFPSETYTYCREYYGSRTRDEVEETDGCANILDYCPPVDERSGYSRQDKCCESHEYDTGTVWSSQNLYFYVGGYCQ